MIALVLEVYAAFCLFSLIAFLVWASVAKVRPELDEPELDLDELEKLKKLVSYRQSDFDPQVGELEDRPAPAAPGQTPTSAAVPKPSAFVPNPQAPADVEPRPNAGGYNPHRFAASPNTAKS